MRPSKVFTIAPGSPFLKTFVTALKDGKIIDGFTIADPFALAKTTIYVPTRRAARALADELANSLIFSSPGSGAAVPSAMLLPRIKPFGGIEETETSLLFDRATLDDPSSEDSLLEDLPLAASEIGRRMQLTELILKWAEALNHAIVRIGPDGTIESDTTERFSVARSVTDAWHLSGQLAQLIDELIIEDITWSQLDPLVLPEFDAYWRITMNFLNIAIESWPEICSEQGWIDAAKRRVLLLAREARKLDEGTAEGPVIALGSPGFNRTTSALLASIARAPQGAVILPGLDQDLDEAAFKMIDHESFGHPQAVYVRLLPILGVTRQDVMPLGEMSPMLIRRHGFLSEALRPADTTDEWITYQVRNVSTDLADALSGITMIEAQDERQEALALAIALREILETPGKTAALVTPDRELARRVRTELLRWNIEIDDSGGDPLNTSPRGLLARLALACITSGMDAKDLAALLANEQVSLGLGRDRIKALAPQFEIAILRSAPVMRFFDQPDIALTMARDAAFDTYAHPAKARIEAEDWDGLAQILERLRDVLSPLRALRGTWPLARWIAAHRMVLDGLVRDADQTDGQDQQDRTLEAGEDAAALEALFDELSGTTPQGLLFDVASYAAFFTDISGEVRLRGPRRAHPRLKILGLIEARLMQADVMLLGGLDETIWPPAAQMDAFLNRPMRAALGLTPPERRLGQATHDFTQAMGAESVILSRAKKRGGTPTVASRLIQRMAALAGDVWQSCLEQGERFLAFAEALDRTPINPADHRPQRPLGRPNPKPPVGLRPTHLSVTQIETLRRDPYAIFAEKILGLKALDALGAGADRRDDGMAVHAVLERCGKLHPTGPLPADMDEQLLSWLREALAARLDDPDFSAFQWPRLQKAIDVYLAFEAERRDNLVRIEVETFGRLPIDLADGSRFLLTARADRLEFHRDQSLVLVDYKTGAPPSSKEIRTGLAPQLTLEAAMAKRGAFGSDAIAQAYGGLYLKLGGADGGQVRPVEFSSGRGKNKDQSIAFDDVAEQHFQGLLILLNQFRDPATGYPSRLAPKFAHVPLPYDHLARVNEWAQGGIEESE
ncbi:double-strand break repair protein AddB [Beijerinckia indica]|uniref:Double-strand break repair protein AddB n=1 Tax=Beijerinckia indica subsp. indica (strain ATCC 9039 / DSM 1715 / NCIMB 8712) TaxID=395963 RepID=B2IGN3_BEII9|nr:double-strand break repair protein AddB [Beijerinckia indica]ACB95794.1 double-strand break repair protein AddB [Beijerinckia indica subsp. indica ATCC 9039]